MYPTWIVPSCGSLHSNCNHVGYKLLTVTFHNEKNTLQNSIPSNGFFDLKHDYGNKTTTQTDTSSSVAHLSLETKAISDISGYWGSNSVLGTVSSHPSLYHWGIKYLGATDMATHLHR